MAYIVGEILAVPGPQAAELLEIDQALFRKRLSLARRKVRAFLAPRCGLYDESNACQCDKQIGYDLKVGWIDRNRLKYARAARTMTMRSLDERFDRAAALYATHPRYEPPATLHEAVRCTLASIDTIDGDIE